MRDKSGSKAHREKMRDIALEKGFGKWMTGKKHSAETKKKMSDARRGKKHPMFGKRHTPEARLQMSIKAKGRTAWNKGLKGFMGAEKHWNWKEDRTKVKLDTERGGPLHKQWSRNIKERDGWKCKIANSDCSGRLEAHHILSWKDFPELRYIINNGITLCHFHHPTKRSEEVRLSPYFQQLVGKAH